MFGVCYYPEHWPESRWAVDAGMMAGLGLRYVRIGEFAWSRLEPERGRFEFDWLDRAIDTLGDAGLSVVLCTPTATPPKWLVDKWPEVLPVDPSSGRTRGFGSRRHYDFSSERYLGEALRISAQLAERYGQHRCVAGWQTDNELCCHDTTLSGSATARAGFQAWCRDRYATIDALNEAWGNVFWSMEYRDFAEIELPIGAVTETSPAHQLAWRRYSSDRVVTFHRRMVEVLRQHSPGRFVTHNFIPMADTGVDNFALADALDFASYDSYPLGRTDLKFADTPAAEFRRYMRTGHPDYAAYSLDQTRGLGDQRFWIMEQQPGPVNWAANNPRPAPGMIRLWTFEAFAHGAECVSYFRWRQAPFAQEQMHAGLLRPDHSKAAAWPEVERAIAELAKIGVDRQPTLPAPVAIVTSADSGWVDAIERQGDGYDADDVLFDYYQALRQIGVDVDFVSPSADLAAYSLVVVPSLPVVDASFVSRLASAGVPAVFGPRAGAKTDEFACPGNLPPGVLSALLPIRVLSVETLRADCGETFAWNGKTYDSVCWREELDPGPAEVAARFEDGDPAVVRHGACRYIATLAGNDFLRDFLAAECREAGVRVVELPADLRIRSRGDLVFAFNYASTAQQLPVDARAEFLLGGPTVRARDLAVWRR